MLCALMYRQNGDLANLLKSVRKKVPQSARLRGGCNRYLGNAQIGAALISVGLPLHILPFLEITNLDLFVQCSITPNQRCSLKLN